MAIVVRRGEEFLVLHRAPAGGAYWHLVAGGVEPGETAEGAAARELLEEVGLSAPLARLTTFEYVPTPQERESRAMAATISVECYVADAPAGWEPALDHEHDDYRWCSRDEATALLFWPEPREAVEIAAAGVRGRAP